MGGKLTTLAVLTAVGLSTGCSTMAGTGALAGGGIGAGTGALIGKVAGNTGAGAAIGAALGAGVGTAVGAEADQKERERADIRRVNAEAQVAAATTRGPLSIDEVIQMSRPSQTGAKVSDDVLIDYIRTSNSRFDLTPADVRFLADNGVSDVVVRAMMNTKYARPAVVRHAAPQTVVVQDSPSVVVYERPYYRPYYYAPPPPVGIGFYGRIR